MASLEAMATPARIAAHIRLGPQRRHPIQMKKSTSRHYLVHWVRVPGNPRQWIVRRGRLRRRWCGWNTVLAGVTAQGSDELLVVENGRITATWLWDDRVQP